MQAGTVTSTADSGEGSLRKVIADAVSGDTITFSSTLAGQTITLTTGLITSAGKNLAIDASALPGGIILNGNGTSRIFGFESGTSNILDGLTMTNGYTSDGGGAIVVSSGANLTVWNSSILGNTADAFGGGICNAGWLTLENCTLSGNSTSSIGGGICTYYGATTALTNCTLSDNAASTTGGGIVCLSGTTELENCTLSGNSASTSGGGIAIASGTLTIKNSIVAGNTAPSDGNIYGTYSGTNNLVDVAPMLSPLGDYGGPTQTMPPLPGSLAIDAGGATALTTDQRGLPRLSGLAMDIGSVEIVQQTTFVQNTNDSGFGSLRQVIADAASGDLITFTNTLSAQTITLTSGQLTPAGKSLTINASALPGGIILNGNGSSRIFGFDAGTTNVLAGLTLTNGYTSGKGGAIYLNSNAVLTVQNTALCGSSAVSSGGGIYSEGALTLNSCTLNGNSANNGGGILNTGGALTLENSTLSGNSVTQVGGGIYNNGSLTITNCTFCGNSANHSGGIYSQPPKWFSLYNSIVAANTAPNYADIYGTYAEYGATHNLVGGAPMLSPLGNYGGPTQTMPPLLGSPAIDAGQAAALTTDQRGLSRPSGLAMDIGAVEIQMQVVLNTNDSGTGSLRQAIANAVSGDSIYFASILSGQTITLTSGQITVDKNLTIDASSLTAGIVLDGNGASRIFEFARGTTNRLMRLMLTHGYTAGDGGGVYLYYDASLTIQDSTLSNNSASTYGGGVFNSGTLTLTGSTLSDNSAREGGGISTFGALTLNNSTLSDNSATLTGGGLFCSLGGSFTLENCTLSENSATRGGGIYSDGYSQTIKNSIVAGNTASVSYSNFFSSRLLYSVSNSLLSGDPMLTPLGNYGGPTQTMPPLPGSPALDAGGATTLTTDQRGMPRMLSACYGPSAVDIGAVEYNGWLAGKDVSGIDPACLLPGSIYDGSTVFPDGFDPETADMCEILSRSDKASLIAQGESKVTADPETYGLYTASAFQELSLDHPFLTYNTDNNSFTLTIGILQTPDLSSTFSNLTGFATSPDPDNGRINIEFPPPNSSARFFKVYADTPSGR